MPQYDVRTSSLPDRTRVAALLDWEDTRLLCSIRQPQAGQPVLALRHNDLSSQDVTRVAEFVLAVGKNVLIAPESNAQFFSTFDGRLKYTVALSNGKNRIRFAGYQDFHAYLKSNNLGEDNDNLQVEVIHERTA